jgi:hypothetical protein
MARPRGPLFDLHVPHEHAMDLTAYRSLLRDSRARRLLTGLAVSSLDDGMSIVTIAWLAQAIAPSRDVGGSLCTGFRKNL